jgi:hypothetical protein
MRLPAGGARTAGLVGALALIAAATLTPQDGRGISRLAHWCWQCGALWLADGASNVLLFLPLGVALAARGWRVPAVVAAGCAVTGLVETLQWVGIPPGRLASRGDLVANAAGALLGAALWRLRGWRRPPTPGGALALAYAWVTGVAAVAVGTALALRPSGTARDDSRPMVSPVTHVPGSGWFEGTTDSVEVDGVRVRRGYTGPVILATRPSPAATRATLHVRGRDPTPAPVPLLVLHDAGAWRPWLAVAQHGTAVQVTLTRAGGAWGLAMPVLSVPGAFAPRAPEAPLRLTVTTTPQAMTVAGRAGPWADARTLPLTPLLGWALLQAEVRTDGTWAPLVATLWLALLAVPVGWWGAQGAGARRPAWGHAVALAVALWGAVALPVPLLASAGPSAAELMQLAAWSGVGAWASRRGIFRHG